MSKGDNIHDVMVGFWKKHSTEANEIEMMLDSMASKLSLLETPEIISLLPDLTDMHVVEIGAGIGRYTSIFAKKVGKIIATDFMESFVKRNKENNGHLPNVEIYQEDVTKMQCQDNSCDLVFSNWLFMYLNDVEMMSLFDRAIHWLRPGGHFFFRESCFYKSGDISRESNPTIYRTPEQYLDAIKKIHYYENGQVFVFKIVVSKSIQTYIEMKSNPNQICWLIKKVIKSENNFCSRIFDDHLNSFDLYTKDDLKSLKGEDFISMTDATFYKDLYSRLDIKKDANVLDIGCGIGSSSFLISKLFGAQVIGLDPSPELICQAQYKLNELKVNGVQFMTQDVNDLKMPNLYFDYIIACSLPIYIHNKISFLRNLLKHLNEGGKIMWLEYCQGLDADFEPLHSNLGLHQYTFSTHHDLIKMFLSLNLKLLELEDVNEKLIHSFNLNNEMLKTLDISTKKNLEDATEKKLAFIQNKNIKYCCFILTK